MATLLTASASKKRKPVGKLNGAHAFAAPQRRQETLRLLRQEIAFIHNAEFEQLSMETVDRALTASEIHHEPVSPRTTIPTGLPAYLANLYTIPLLSADGEAALFRKMNYLKYRANLCRVALDPSQSNGESTAEIRRLLGEAEAVRNRIVECNLRLVVSIARRFADARFSFEELVSEGNMILMKAIEKFDYSRGYRFSTYATHSVQRHFFRHFRNARRRNTHEIAMTEEHLSQLSDDSGEQSLSPEISDGQIGQILAQFDEKLDEREQYILQERFGIGPSGTARTLQSLSQELQVSKERVRQLHHKAIAKMRKGLDRLFPEMMLV